jgi:hypothetical protein
VIAEAFGALPEDGAREALEALLGVGPTAEMPHAGHRSAAMQALGLDPTVHSEHSFRKTREKELLWDLAGVLSRNGKGTSVEEPARAVPGAGTTAPESDAARPATSGQTDQSHPLATPR